MKLATVRCLTAMLESPDPPERVCIAKDGCYVLQSGIYQRTIVGQPNAARHPLRGLQASGL